jgi:probable HAF family extracellular repeat protein
MAYIITTVDFPSTAKTVAVKTEALGINENGQIVGLYVDATNVTHGFLAQDTGFTTIDDPLGSTMPGIGSSVATGINDPGQIVGYYFDASHHAHGFLDSKGTFTTIAGPSGATDTFVEGIAENGRIVGYYLDANRHAHGFLDDKNALTTVNFANATIAAGSVDTFVTGINDPGQITGYYVDANHHAHGFVDDKGSFTTIDGPSGSTDTFVEGIAENGRIVGYYLDTTGHAHAFVDAKGVLTTIAGPAGATDSFAQGINDEGQIAGFYIDANGVRHGFAATPHIAVRDTSDDEDLGGVEEAYGGPVERLEHQFIFDGTDSVNISVSDDNWFLHGGPGQDALQAHGGYNVLDGGTGSNFLTGGSGTDTFFVDDRNPSGDLWSTVNGFHTGDDATVFGIVATDNVHWFDNQGAAGFTGLTMHVTNSSGVTASLTLAGYSSADLGNGHLMVQFGSEQDGTPFMHVIAS